MSKPLTPDKILNNVNTGILSKADAAKILISLIEASEESKIRTESLEALDKISYKTEEIFKILENHLISDKSPSVRNAAAKAITNNFLKVGLNSLNYAILNDKSPLVVKTIFDFFDNFNGQPLKLFNKKLEEWMIDFALEIGVVPEEAKFFLDLEALFAKGNENYEIDTTTYKYFKNITDFKTSEPWLALKNEHVEILNFNYFNWRYLKDNKDSIESIMKLHHPDLFLNSIQHLNFSYNNSFAIPESIGLLKYLKILNLGRNNIKEIPETISNLVYLEKLDLSHNNLKEIPNIIKNLKSLKFLKINKNQIQSIPDSLKSFIVSLERFKY